MDDQGLYEEDLTRSVIGAFFDVYNTLGSGHVEHVYVLALERELEWRGHRVAREVSVRIHYKGEELCQQRLDMLVDDKLVVEAKAADKLQPHASRQLYNYLKATRLRLGLLFNFGLEPEFRRVIYRHAE